MPSMAAAIWGSSRSTAATASASAAWKARTRSAVERLSRFAVAGLRASVASWANSSIRFIEWLDGQRFEQAIEVFEPGIFDDHAAPAILVFDPDAESQGSLQLFFRFPYIRIG